MFSDHNGTKLKINNRIISVILPNIQKYIVYSKITYEPDEMLGSTDNILQ